MCVHVGSVIGQNRTMVCTRAAQEKLNLRGDARVDCGGSAALKIAIVIHFIGGKSRCDRALPHTTRELSRASETPATRILVRTWLPTTP